MVKPGQSADDDRVFEAQLITGSVGRPGDDALGEQWDIFEKFRAESSASDLGFTVWVYEIPSDAVGNPSPNAKSMLLFTAPIDRYTMAQIFERCKKDYMPRGAGTMITRVMVRKTSGERGSYFNELFVIKKSPVDDPPETETKGSGDIAALSSMFEKFMYQNNQMMREFLIRQNAAPAIPQKDSVETAIQMVTAMTGMMAALNRSAVAPVSGGGIVEQIQAMREMMNLSREFAGGEPIEPSEGEGTLGILKAVAPIAGLISDVIKAGQNRAPGPAPAPHVQRRLAAPAATESVTTGSAPARPQVAPQPEPQGNQQMFMQISKSLGELVILSKTGADPVGLAPTIVDSMPEAYDDTFFAIMAAPNWLDRLAAFNPSVKESPEVIEWITRLRGAILEQYTDEPELAPQSAALRPTIPLPQE